jgi:hypothetical protein
MGNGNLYPELSFLNISLTIMALYLNIKFVEVQLNIGLFKQKVCTKLVTCGLIW